MESLTLNAILQKYKGTGKTLLIGSASGYFLVGTAEFCDANLDEFSEGWHNYFKDALQSNENAIYNFMHTPIKPFAGSSPKEYVAKLRDKASMLETYCGNSERYNERVENYKPMRERAVINEYSRIAENTVAIITEGEEQGDFWDIEEWNNALDRLPKYGRPKTISSLAQEENEE